MNKVLNENLLIDGDKIACLREHALTINGFTFPVAVETVQRKPYLFRLAKRGNQQLYVLPGGARATERQIRTMTKGN